MNNYLKNLKKIEFVVTYACTGRCIHCSEGNHPPCGIHIDPAPASAAVKSIASAYDIKTVMAFGGEPLLYPDAVYSIMNTAWELGIPKRQVITNGFFSKGITKIKEVVSKLAQCGINDLLLSADAFHQEHIPLDTVKAFALEARSAGIPIRIQPAWLVSREDGNRYNLRTKEILCEFRSLGIEENEGNLIFPEGNAKIHLAEYFTDSIPQNPYADDPYDIRCLSVDPDGSVLGGNIYENDIMDIVERYEIKRKTLQERWDEETLTDNTQFENCKQCKTCIFQDDGSVWSNHYTKVSCQKYPYPKIKPLTVIDNELNCPFFSVKL